MLLSFTVEEKHDGINTGVALPLIRHTERTEPVNQTGKVQCIVCLRWTTASEVDYPKVKNEMQEAGE